MVAVFPAQENRVGDALVHFVMCFEIGWRVAGNMGVGIIRLTEPMGPHAAGALVITLIFIERQ